MLDASQRYVPLSVLFRLLMNRLGPDRTACWGISSSTLTQVTITGLQRKEEKQAASLSPTKTSAFASHPPIRGATRRVTWWKTCFKFTELQPWSPPSLFGINFKKKKTLSSVEKLSTDHKQESHYFQFDFNKSANKPMCPIFMPCWVVSHKFRQDRAHPPLIISLIRGKTANSQLVIHALLWWLLIHQGSCSEATYDISMISSFAKRNRLLHLNAAFFWPLLLEKPPLFIRERCNHFFSP